MAKVKVMVEGKETEVELPAGYLSPDEVRAGFVSKEAASQLVEDRIGRYAKKAKQELLDDEEFRKEALTTWNIKPGEKGTGKATPAEIEEALKEMERTKVTPALKLVDELKGKIGTLTRSQLHSQIIAEATAAGVQRQFLKPLPGSKVPAIIGMIDQHFGFDETVNDWLVRNADGKSFAVSGEAGAAHPYKGVKHFFADFAKDPDFRGFLEAPQKGAGLEKGGAGGTTTVSRSDARAVGENAEKILKGEVTLVD